jgi:hypothetical protein
MGRIHRINRIQMRNAGRFMLPSFRSTGASG